MKFSVDMVEFLSNYVTTYHGLVHAFVSSLSIDSTAQGTAQRLVFV